MKKKFTAIEMTENNAWTWLTETKVKCPSCSNLFGLDKGFIEKLGDVNIHYNCPYCGHGAGLKKD